MILPIKPINKLEINTEHKFKPQKRFKNNGNKVMPNFKDVIKQANNGIAVNSNLQYKKRQP